MKKKEKMKKKVTLGWKPEKGSLEQKQKNFQRLVDRAKRRMRGKRSDSIRSFHEVLYPFRNQESEPFVTECFPPNSWVYHGGSWHLSNCHIQRLEKINFFKMLDFQRIHFFQKKEGLGNVSPLFSTKLWK